MLLSVKPEHVAIGMYIHAFDGSWLHHPFWRAGFVLTTVDALDRIRSSAIDAVVIDTAKGKGLEDRASAGPPSVSGISTPRRRTRTSMAIAPAKPDSQAQRNPEIERARHIIGRGRRIVMRLFDEARMGRLSVSGDVDALVDDISRSLERSRSTIINMARLKTKDEYTYLHSVAVCALMINFGRQLGLDEAVVRDLGVAGLFHDVGKMAVPDALLNKQGALSPAEFDLIKTHTTSGGALLDGCEDVPPVARDVALHHHERIDGKGYPFGLNGGQLSVAARMGAICDIYDALTSERIYKAAWSPAEAIGQMDGWTGHLDDRLLFTFMQSIGVFPTGLLVRMRSNRLAVILPNGRRGSRAKARTFYSATDHVFLPIEDVRVADDLGGDQVVGRENPLNWPISDWPALQADLLSDRHGPPEKRKRRAGA